MASSTASRRAPQSQGPAQSIPGAPHAPGAQSRDAEGARGGKWVRAAQPEPPHGGAGLHREPRQLPEPSDELLGEPLREIGICGVGGQVVEVQHRDAVRDRRYGTDRRAAWRRRAVGALSVGRSDGRTDGQKQPEHDEFPSDGPTVGPSQRPHRPSATSAWNRGSLRRGSYIQWRRKRAAWKRRCQGVTRPTQAMALSVWPSWAYAPARYPASVRESPLGLRRSFARRVVPRESSVARALAVSPASSNATATSARLGAGTSPSSTARAAAARPAAPRPDRRAASAGWAKNAGKAGSIERPRDAAATASKGPPPLLRDSAMPA